jgi:hypothetical protein
MYILVARSGKDKDPIMLCFAFCLVIMAVRWKDQKPHKSLGLSRIALDMPIRLSPRCHRVAPYATSTKQFRAVIHFENPPTFP